jgi:hypothetical protein
MDKRDLILRPTIMAGDRLKNDFEVFFEERRVGRIMLTVGSVGQNPSWDWHVNPPLPVPSWCKGSEPDLDQAKAAFREAWERFYSSLSPEAIAHWHHTADARK